MIPRAITIAYLTVAFSLPCGGQAGGPVPNHKGRLQWNPHAVQRAEKTIEETSALSTEQKKELVKGIIESLNANGEADPDEQKQIRKEAPETRVKLIDLNGDGIPEVIAQATGNYFCGVTGNCFLWIFSRVGDHYKVLLQAVGIQGFTVQKTRSFGFHDLVLTRHESALSSDLFFYSFSKGGYHEKACYEASWVRMVGDERVELKDPVITPCGR